MRARRRPGRRRAARMLTGLLLTAAMGGAAARAGDSPPGFFIETITVETRRLSPEIVLSESLLEEGREYSEAELREAVHRINRLPFVLLAEFSLGKGSERGRYELVVQVYEARRWFSQLGLGVALNDPIDRFRVDDFGDGFLRNQAGDKNFDAIIGRRFAVGRRGILFGSFGTEDGLFAVGYQHYDLFDRNILFSITAGGEDRFASRSRALRAQLGIPIRGNHALRLLAGWNWFDFSSRFFFQSIEIREAELEIAWVFNSLDDPVLPREGSLFELGVAGSKQDDVREFLRFDGTVSRLDSSARGAAVVASASRHWPLTTRQSVSAGLGGLSGEGQAPGQQWRAEANVAHQVFLLRNQEPGRWRELRWETRLTGLHEEYTDELVRQGFPGEGNIWSLRAGLTYRNGWGLFRLFVEHAERSFG